MTYIYVCEHCKIKYEKKHGMTEEPIFKCQNKITLTDDDGSTKTKKCNYKLKRVITGGLSTIFKGSGWSRAGKKDKNYNRKKQLETFHDHPKADPYAGYRNWNEESI